MIDGVCGGIAEYLGLDATLVRIAWVLLTLLGGSGIIIYIIAMIVMPANPQVQASSAGVRDRSSNNQKFWGFLLVGIGIVLLLSNLGVSFWHHWWGLSWDVLLAVILILAGVAFLFGGRNSITPPVSNEPVEPAEAATGEAFQGVPPASSVRRLFRSRTERKLFGVCGGLADYFAVDPTIIRLLFVVAAIASFGFALFAYFIMAIVVPEQPAESRA